MFDVCLVHQAHARMQTGAAGGGAAVERTQKRGVHRVRVRADHVLPCDPEHAQVPLPGDHLRRARVRHGRLSQRPTRQPRRYATFCPPNLAV